MRILGYLNNSELVFLYVGKSYLTILLRRVENMERVRTFFTLIRVNRVESSCCNKKLNRSFRFWRLRADREGKRAIRVEQPKTFELRVIILPKKNKN